MKKLDSFILKSFLGPFVMTFLIVIFVLMLQFLWLYIDELVGKGLSFGVIVEFLGWGSATLIPMALPLASLRLMAGDGIGIFQLEGIIIFIFTHRLIPLLFGRDMGIILIHSLIEHI